MTVKKFVLVFTVVFSIGSLSGCNSSIFDDTMQEAKEVQEQVELLNEEIQGLEEDDMSMEAQENVSLGEASALESAEEYLAYMAFSRLGLIEQLEYEGYSEDEAIYAVDNCTVNWREQAAKMAQEYLDYTSFSRSGLIEQLEYEGFTHKQAVYGVEAVGY